jgi:hypothetical protein
MQTQSIPASEAFSWIRTGFERVRREPARWLGMTLIYLVVALLLRPIPSLLYNLVLAFLTPIMLASALIAARSAPVPTPADWRGWLRALIVDALRDLFQVFRREDHTFAIVIVCIVTLGLVAVVNIPALLISGGSMISGLAGAGLAAPLRLETAVGMAVVALLYLLLLMALLYIVPLTVFGNRQAIPSLTESFLTCVRHRAPLALFIAPFLGVNLLIMVAFGLSHWLGYLLLVGLGVVALPAFVIGLYSSYQTLFETPAVAAASPINPNATP